MTMPGEVYLIIGALISGLLLILSNHLVERRADLRHRNQIDRDDTLRKEERRRIVRDETVEKIRDFGIRATTALSALQNLAAAQEFPEHERLRFEVGAKEELRTLMGTANLTMAYLSSLGAPAVVVNDMRDIGRLLHEQDASIRAGKGNDIKKQAQILEITGRVHKHYMDQKASE